MKNTGILRIKMLRIIVKLFLISLILIFTYKLINIQNANIKKANELEELNKKINNTVKENENLKKQIKSNLTDEFKEKYAREELNMVKYGERIFYSITKE